MLAAPLKPECPPTPTTATTTMAHSSTPVVDTVVIQRCQHRHQHMFTGAPHRLGRQRHSGNTADAVASTAGAIAGTLTGCIATGIAAASLARKERQRHCGERFDCIHPRLCISLINRLLRHTCRRQRRQHCCLLPRQQPAGQGTQRQCAAATCRHIASIRQGGGELPHQLLLLVCRSLSQVPCRKAGQSGSGSSLHLRCCMSQVFVQLAQQALLLLVGERQPSGGAGLHQAADGGPHDFAALSASQAGSHD